MKYWFQRFKKLRLEKKMSQGKMARALGVDASSISRYERSDKDVDLTENFLMRLSKFFTEEEIRYIKNGDMNIKIDTDFGIAKVKEQGDVYSDVPRDVAMIMEVVGELSTEQRREVLRYVLEINVKQ